VSNVRDSSYSIKLQMKFIDLTLQSPEQNVAFDEALVNECEDGFGDEILRFWEPHDYFVVLGYSSKVHAEVNIDSCRNCTIPIFRRYSGGGTVVQGPGCLNFSLVLKTHDIGPLSNIAGTNSFIMRRHIQALQPFIEEVINIGGYTDLTIRQMKFSGNSQRRRQRFLLFHGTFLLRFDISIVEKLLLLPEKQPPYRNNRSHTAFLTNLAVSPYIIKEALQKEWDAYEHLRIVPVERIDRLVKDRYASPGWTFRF
jgi:lipoate---protein ligase